MLISNVLNVLQTLFDLILTMNLWEKYNYFHFTNKGYQGTKRPFHLNKFINPHSARIWAQFSLASGSEVLFSSMLYCHWSSWMLSNDMSHFFYKIFLALTLSEHRIASSSELLQHVRLSVSFTWHLSFIILYSACDFV